MIGYFIGSSFKWGLPSDQFKAKYTRTPQVDRIIMLLVLYHFWWQVIQCATNGTPSANLKMIFRSLYCKKYLGRQQTHGDTNNENIKAR